MAQMTRALNWKTGKYIFKFQEREKGVNPVLHSGQMFHFLLKKKGEKSQQSDSTHVLFLKKMSAAFAFQQFNTVPNSCCWIKP